MHSPMPAFSLLAACLLAGPAASKSHVVEAGEALALKEDLVLSGKDTLDIRGTPEKRCTIIGNGHSIRSQGDWTGSVRIRHCDIRGLGAPARLTEDSRRIAAEFPAIRLAISGKGSLVVEHCD